MTLSMRMAFYGVALGLIALDQATKWWARVGLASMSVDWGILRLDLVFNKGAAYGLFHSYGGVLMIIGVIVSGYLAVMIPRLAKKRWEYGGYMFLLAGAIGNTMDRAIAGRVTDFINIHIIPVFNIADVYLNIGFGLLIGQWVLDYRQKNRD